MRVAVSKTTFKLEKKWHTFWSRCDMFSKHRAPWKVGFWILYKGNPYRRVGSLVATHLQKLAFEAFIDSRKSDNNALPVM